MAYKSCSISTITIINGLSKDGPRNENKNRDGSDRRFWAPEKKGKWNYSNRSLIITDFDLKRHDSERHKIRPDISHYLQTAPVPRSFQTPLHLPSLCWRDRLGSSNTTTSSAVIASLPTLNTTGIIAHLEALRWVSTHTCLLYTSDAADE